MKQMPKKRKGARSADAFELPAEASKEKTKNARSDLVAPLKPLELFAEGSITINKRICQGIECRLCLKACPTNALFWTAGEVGVIEELCIYCGACVLSCIVDDCIEIVRKRTTGEIESFSRPKDFAKLQHSINANRRHERTRSIFLERDDYLKRYSTKRER